MSKDWIIIIFGGDGATASLLFAAVADKRSLVKAAAGFTDELPANLIAFETAAAFPVTEKKLFTDIGLLTAITLGREVLRIIKTALVPGVQRAVKLHLLRNCSRIFAQELRDISEGTPIVKSIGDIFQIFESLLIKSQAENEKILRNLRR